MANGNERSLRLAAAGVAAALLLAAGPSAQAQPEGGCPRSGADMVDQGYRFTFDSFERTLPPRRRQIVHCVVNRHPARNLWLDWPDAGIKGWVKAGGRGSAISTGPAARGVSHRSGVLWFGSRPRKRTVSTPVFAAGTAPGDVFALRARPMLLRAAFQDPAPAPEGSWSSIARIDVPVAKVVEPLLAKLRPKGAQAGPKTLDRKAFRQVTRYLEARPEALVPFEMTFVTEAPGGPGGPALRYSCTYQAAGPALLRFDDPALHRAMFGSNAPFVARAWPGRPQVMRSRDIAAASGVRSRTARLEILLPDGVTVIGSIGFDYLAPATG